MLKPVLLKYSFLVGGVASVAYFFTGHCSRFFCFSLEVLITLNQIQVNIKGDGPS